MTENDRIHGLTQEIENHIISIRRTLHAHPELSMQECETSALICAELSALGIPFRMAGEYGVIGELVLGRGGRTVLFRADMDALPMQEDAFNLKRGKTSISERPGVAHTCGHDAHTAMLLGAARILSSCRDIADGRVLFCFEQGEEVGGGWRKMLKALENESIDAAWAIHVTSLEAAGTISVDPGARTAGSIFMDITIQGMGAHGAYPNLAHDPLLCAADIVSSFSHVMARDLAPGSRAALSVGSFHAGSAGNIIPETANFKGTARFYEKETSKLLEMGIKRHVEALCTLHQCIPAYDAFNVSPPVFNDERLSKLAFKALRDDFSDKVISSPPMMGTESFSMYVERWPGVLAFLGVGSEEQGSLGTVMHSPKFDLDERALKLGSLASVRFALGVLTEKEEI